jgi:tetratricopeptide (TPR) repeat protein
MELDPGFASAWGMAARSYTLRHANAWMADSQEISETGRLARRAVELGRDDAVALCMAGWAFARVLHDMENGASHIERALTLNPNLAAGWQYSGLLQAYLGNPELAVSNLARAMRLSPLDTDLYAMQAGSALAEFVAGRYEEAARWAEMALREQPNFFPALRNAATSYALAGRLDLAKQALSRVLQADPELRISNVPARVPLRRPDDLARYQEGLRLAGLPE